MDGRAVGPLGSSEAPRVGWGLPDAAVAFLLSLLAASIAEAPFITHGKLPQSAQVPASLAGLAAQTTTAVVYLSFAARRGLGSLRADFGLHLSLRDSGWFVVGLGLAFVAGIGLTPIVDAGNLNQGQSSQSVVRVFQSAHGWEGAAFVVAVLVVAPLGEELLFRGALLRALMRRTNPTTAVAVSALVFALVHLALDPGAGFAVPALFFLGLVSGDRALRTGDLSESFFLHSGFNLLAVLQILV